MPARATASGTISFGLVSIPVKVYPASRSKSVHFNMLHEKDKSRLKQQYVCASCGEVVERGDTVKGYEYSRGQYVVLTDEELKALEQKSDRTIEIEGFVPIRSVDPIFYEKANLLGPDKGGQKAYRLLADAMYEMGVVAVGRFATRGRHQLVLIRPLAQGLVMQGLHYADEVRAFDDIEFGDAVDVKRNELDLAKQLIEQLSEKEFEATQYEDEYRQAVLELVDKKVAGEEIVAMPAEEPREKIVDLVAALKKSIAEKRGEAPTAARQRKPARAKGQKQTKTTGRKKTAAK